MNTQAQLRQHTERAGALLSRGALDEAALELSRAIYLDPRDAVLRQRLAELFVRLGRKAEAVREFQQVAGHFAAKGELLKAIAFSRAILDLEPAHEETQRALAHLYARRGDASGPHRSLPRSMSAAARPASAAPHAPNNAPDDAPTATSDLHAREGKDDEPLFVDLSQAQRTPLFSMLDEETFLSLLATLVVRAVKAGEVLVREGEPGDSMFVVVHGAVDVLRGEPGPDARKLATLGEGSFFGEVALVARSPRLATVVAAADGLLFEIDREALNELALRHPLIERVVLDFYRGRLLANLLAASPIFRGLSSDERKRIAARFTLRSFSAGTAILEQNHPGAGLFAVLRGQCEVVHTTEAGARHAYPPLREGDLFGEISLLFGTPCTATVRALTHADVLELPAAAFNELVRPNKAVGAMLDRMARERLSRTTDLLLSRDEILDSWLV